MARALGQLRCGRCEGRFWSEVADWASAAVLCPRCGAAYVNTGALPYDDAAYFESIQPSTPLLRNLSEWMRTWWADDPPSYEMRLWMVYLQSVQVAVVDGFATCVVRATPRNPMRGMPRDVTICMVAAWVPDAKRVGDALPRGVEWARVGLSCATPGFRPPGEIAQGLVAYARSLGAEPAYALDEVDDPTPLPLEAEPPPDPAADAQLESRTIACQGCGAPASVEELVGGARCPYCGAVQGLPIELVNELRLHRRRVRAAQLRSALPRLTVGSPRSAGSSGPVLHCVGCGAPNPHRGEAVDELCGSCGAPLIPSREAMARGLAQLGERALDAHGASGSEYARRLAGYYRQGEASGRVAGLIFALPTFAMVALGGLCVVPAILTHQAKWLLPLLVNAPVALVIGVVWSVRRKSLKALLGRWRPRFAALAEQLGASPFASPGELVAWGARWWRGAVPPARLSPGPGWAAMAFQIAGFPMVASVHVEVRKPLMPGALPTQPHAGLLLAGRAPRDVRYWTGRDEAAQLRQLFSEHGYALEIGTGGLELRARPELLERMRAEPDRLGQLAPLAFALARFANELRFEPPAYGAEPEKRT